MKLKGCIFWIYSFCIIVNLVAIDCVNKDFIQEIEQVLPPNLNNSDNYIVTEENATKLYALVKKLALSFDIAMPQIYLYKGDNARALSLIQTNGAIEIGSDELQNLTSSQIEAIIAHELAHIKKYHKLKAGLMASFLLVSNAIVTASMCKKTDFASSYYIAKPVFLFLLLTLIEMPFAYFYKLAQEKEADLVSVAITKNPQALLEAYINFNERIVQNDGIISYITNLFGQHPSLEDEKQYLSQSKDL